MLLVGLQCLKGGTQNLSLEGANSFTQAKNSRCVSAAANLLCDPVCRGAKLASSVILGLLRYWPITNSQKEVMFLSGIKEFHKCICIGLIGPTRDAH